MPQTIIQKLKDNVAKAKKVREITKQAGKKPVRSNENKQGKTPKTS